MWLMVQVCYTLKMILNCHGWSDRVLSVTKIRDENDVTDRIGTVYVENDTKLSWLIGSGVDCDEIQIGQQCD